MKEKIIIEMIMKYKMILAVAIVFSAFSDASSQKLYYTRNGHIDFFSSTPMENIKADNNKVSSVIDINTGDLEFSALIAAFQFEKALMQEHFNENYMESEKFPKAMFKGKIMNLAAVKFSEDGTYNADITGTLTIHGVTKEITTKATFVVKDGKFKAQSTFVVRPEDYNIEIPKLVREKIAKEIKVSVDNNYEPLNK